MGQNIESNILSNVEYRSEFIEIRFILKNSAKFEAHFEGYLFRT
jgi:hypothetical protein